jgi:hypothetical protein
LTLDAEPATMPPHGAHCRMDPNGGKPGETARVTVDKKQVRTNTDSEADSSTFGRRLRERHLRMADF